MENNCWPISTRGLKMDRAVGFLKKKWPAWIVTVLLFSFLLLLYVDGLSIHLSVPAGEMAWVWPNKYLTGLCLLVSLLLPGVAYLLMGTAGEGKCESDVSLQRTCIPLLFLPFTFVIFLLWPFTPYHGLANFFIYIPAMIFALALYRLPGLPSQRPVLLHLTPLKTVFLVIFLMSLFFWLTGYYFTLSCGAHSGDEGHYLIQANSLYLDHDLDILNNLDENEKSIVATRGKDYMHISPNSRGGHYYSWHPFGLSFLLSFTVPGGVLFRHLVLGMLAGLGCGGMILLSQLVGAGKRSSFLLCGLFWLSTLWGIYASRALPETAGATLTIFLAASVLAVKRSPRLSLFGAMVCCLGLPWLHVRFLPISAIGACFFLLQGYRFQHQVFRKWLLPIFLLGVLVVGGFYVVLGFYLFDSGTGYSSSGFFNQPLAMFTYIGGSRGLVTVLPIISCSLWVVIWSIVFDRENREFSLMVLLIFLAILVTSCSSSSFYDGAAMPGRMMLVGVPLSIPLLARFFDRASPVNRWFFLFLSVIPVLTFFLLLLYLPDVKRDFAMPYKVLPVVAPFLRSLSNPFASHGALLAGLLFVGSFVLIFSQQKRTRLHVLIIFFLFLAACYSLKPVPLQAILSEPMKQENSRIVSTIDLGKAKIWATGKETPQRSVYELFANALEMYTVDNTPVASTMELSEKQDGRVVLQNALEANDWKGRIYKWVTMAPPFSVSESASFFCLGVEKGGTSHVDVAAVELSPSRSNPLLEKEISFGVDGYARQCYALEPQGVGKVYLAVRLSGEPGYLRIHALHWLPLDARLLDTFHLSLPYPL